MPVSMEKVKCINNPRTHTNVVAVVVVAVFVADVVVAAVVVVVIHAFLTFEIKTSLLFLFTYAQAELKMLFHSFCGGAVRYAGGGGNQKENSNIIYVRGVHSFIHSLTGQQAY